MPATLVPYIVAEAGLKLRVKKRATRLYSSQVVGTRSGARYIS